LRTDLNQYLKWAFSEVVNSICINKDKWPHRHVNRLYEKVRTRRGHTKAIWAVARHLAEAT
jgi:hypothetical protein